MTRITAADVRKVAQLARLELPEAKIATYTGQLERILDYVAQLEQVDTEGVPPTTRAVEVVNVTRADAVETTPVREELLNLAPSAKAISSACRRSSALRPANQGPLPTGTIQRGLGETAVRCSSSSTRRRA